MRTVLAVTIALALCGPQVALAADTPPGLSQMVAAYQEIQSVRVVEKFENGATATVDILPGSQWRVAESGGQDPALIVKVATQPIDGAAFTSNYNITSLGKKTIDGARTDGFKVVAPDGTYTAMVWVNEFHLPMIAHVDTQGHHIDVTYGDYNSAALIATPH
jgi:outer membrane lipoprotein-sorting protein